MYLICVLAITSDVCPVRFTFFGLQLSIVINPILRTYYLNIALYENLWKLCIKWRFMRVRHSPFPLSSVYWTRHINSIIRIIVSIVYILFLEISHSNHWKCSFRILCHKAWAWAPDTIGFMNGCSKRSTVVSSTTKISTGIWHGRIHISSFGSIVWVMDECATNAIRTGTIRMVSAANLSFITSMSWYSSNFFFSVSIKTLGTISNLINICI